MVRKLFVSQSLRKSGQFLLLAIVNQCLCSRCGRNPFVSQVNFFIYRGCSPCHCRCYSSQSLRKSGQFLQNWLDCQRRITMLRRNPFVSQVNFFNEFYKDKRHDSGLWSQSLRKSGQFLRRRPEINGGGYFCDAIPS